MGGLIEEHAPATEIEARLVRRLASVLWRQERADRLGRKLLARAEPPRIVHAASGRAPTDPRETFDQRHFEAIRRYRADASREITRLIHDLRQLRDERAAAAAVESAPRNEPGAGDAPDLIVGERLEVERMLASGDPA